MFNSLKSGFANAIADFYLPPMSDGCMRYGMTWGCDTDCPVLNRGECELQENETKELYKQIKQDGEGVINV